MNKKAIQFLTDLEMLSKDYFEGVIGEVEWKDKMEELKDKLRTLKQDLTAEERDFVSLGIDKCSNKMMGEWLTKIAKVETELLEKSNILLDSIDDIQEEKAKIMAEESKVEELEAEK